MLDDSTDYRNCEPMLNEGYNHDSGDQYDHPSDTDAAITALHLNAKWPEKQHLTHAKV